MHGPGVPSGEGADVVGSRGNGEVGRGSEVESACQVPGDRTPPVAEVRHLGAEPPLDEPQHRGVVEDVRAHQAAAGPRGDDDRGDAEAEADRSADPARMRGQPPDREILARRSRWWCWRSDVIEEPAVLIVADDHHGLTPDLWTAPDRA